MTYLADLTKLLTISSAYNNTSMTRTHNNTSMTRTHNNTSMTRTPMAHLPWLIQTLVWIPIQNHAYSNTVDSRYLEFQGTQWNTSRYPYLVISDLQNEEKIIRTTTFKKYMCNWTLKFGDILKIMWKKGEIVPSLFHNIFSPVVKFSCLGRDQIFTSR